MPRPAFNDCPSETGLFSDQRSPKVFGKPVRDLRHADPSLGRVDGKSLAQNASEWFGRLAGIL
jgi:hypothetical protein